MIETYLCQRRSRADAASCVVRLKHGLKRVTGGCKGVHVIIWRKWSYQLFV